MKKRFGRALVFGLLCFLLCSNPLLASNLSSAYGYDPDETGYNGSFQDHQNKVYVIPAPPESLLIVSPPPEFTFQQPEKAIKKKNSAIEPSRNPDIPVSKPAQMIPGKDIKKHIALPPKKTVELEDSTLKIKPVISPELKRGKVVKPQMQQKSLTQPALSLPKIESKPVATASVSEIRVATKADTSADLPQGIFGVTSFEGGLRVESNSMLEGTPVEPGQVLTLSLMITNMSNRVRNVVEEFNLPPGFSLTFPVAEFTIAPMESFNSLVMINVPRSISSGEHEINYNVFDPYDKSFRGNLSFKFVIKSVAALKFIIEDQPENVIGNQSFVITGRVLNSGNASITTRLKVVSPAYLKTKVTPANLELGPGKSESVKIDVVPHKSSGQSIDLRFIAENLGKGPKELINQMISVSIQPLSARSMDFTRRLPGFLTFNHFGDGQRSASQWQLSAKGSLDDKNRRVLDFLWRGKNELEDMAMSSLRDLFFLGYRDDRNVFRLGEQSFNLSSLTGSAGSAEGFSADLHQGMPTSYGLIFYKSRYLVPQSDGSGFYISHALNDKTFLRLNHRVMTNTKRIEQTKESITSLEVKMSPSANSTLNAEFGHSARGGPQGLDDQAYSAIFNKRLEHGIGIQLSRTYVGPEYGGDLTGAETNRTSINVPVKKNLSVNYSYSTYEQKPAASANPTSISQNSRSDLALRFRMNRTRDLSLQLSEFARFDSLNSSFSNLDHSVRATLTDTWWGIRLGYTFDRSKNQDRLRNSASWTSGHQLTASYRLGKAKLNAFAGTQIHGADFGTTSPDSNNLGLAVDWEIIENLSFKFNYRETFHNGFSSNGSSSDLVLAYKFVDNSTIDLSMRNNDSWRAEEGETQYRLTYTKSFGIPIGSDFRLGGVRGVVYDALSSDSVPLPNITVLMHRLAAITDDHGRFMFANMRPGTYTIDIDRRTIGLNKISHQLPASVLIIGGKIENFDIGLVEGARLTGQVSIRKPDKLQQTAGKEIALIGLMPGKEAGSESVAGLIVELSMGDAVQRRVTDADGRYSFSGLAPGSWQYKLHEVNLPEGYKIDTPVGSIVLVAKKEVEQNFTVSPRIRKIMIIDED